MKIKHIKLFTTGFIVSLILICSSSFSQSRLPDGTIIYKDGSRRLPNGTVIYPNGTNRSSTNINRTIDGILHPNRTTTVYNNRYPRRVYRNNRQWMPPGQAKKIYGGNARDYAPGHNKDRDNDNHDNENHHGNGHGNDHEKGNGHGHDKNDR